MKYNERERQKERTRERERDLYMHVTSDAYMSTNTWLNFKKYKRYIIRLCILLQSY